MLVPHIKNKVSSEESREEKTLHVSFPSRISHTLTPIISYPFLPRAWDKGLSVTGNQRLELSQFDYWNQTYYNFTMQDDLERWARQGRQINSIGETYNNTSTDPNAVHNILNRTNIGWPKTSNDTDDTPPIFLTENWVEDDYKGSKNVTDAIDKFGLAAEPNPNWSDFPAG